MKKGGNAVEATRKQPLGRASSRSIGCRLPEVKGVIAWWARGAQPVARSLSEAAQQGRRTAASRPPLIAKALKMWTTERTGFRHLLVTLALTLSALSVQAFSWQSNGQLDRDLITETVLSLAAVVEREYFDPDVAARVDATLRARLDEGRYFEVQSLESLATTLTDDLYESTSDKHLAVAVAQPTDPGSRTAEANNDSRHVRGRRSNFGAEHIQILAGNVGYLNITYFFRPDEARDAVAAAMQSLQHADALIVDMRTNAGGSPGTVALVASYFFEEAGLLLFEIIPRYGARDAYSTAAPAVLNRDGVRPLYVLTSARTFSAGEGLAFLVQEQQRGEIVGEKTAGAANPGRPYPVNPHFEVTVPNGQVLMAITGRNWEGVGVTPDIAVPATEALRVAHIHALRSLLGTTPNGSWADSLRRELEALEAERKRR